MNGKFSNPKYVIKTNKGYIEYLSNKDGNLEYSVISSIIYAKFYHICAVDRTLRLLRANGIKCKKIIVEGC